MRDERNKRFGKALLALTLAFVLLFTSVAGAVEVFAEEGLKTIDFANGIVVEKPEPKAPITKDAKAKDEKASPVIENDAKEEKAELELGGEIVGVPVGATIPAPTITKAFIGTNTISGGNVHVDRVSGKVTRGTVHVTLKDKDGAVKADNLTFTPKSGKNWTVNLPAGVTIAEGDTVTAYQEFDGQNSPETTANAMDSLAKQNKDKLKMPTGEIWIEQTSSNIVNEDEQAEAVKMLKDANTDIAGDIKSVKFSINTAEHAYYEVTYTDGSTSGQVEAPNLKIKQVTETSRSPEIGSITIVDNVIKGKLSGEGPFDGIKVQLILNVKKEKADKYCNENKCTVDKDSSTPVDVTLQDDGTFSYTLQAWDSLTLDQIVGVSVKEPHKFVSCSTTTVKSVTVEKTEVKDPRKLTGDDKKAIDAAIRKGYTVNGESKLPNGTGYYEGAPAVIQIDDSGNVKIFSGNDVVVNEWDDDGKAIPEKNGDGSIKLKDGAEPKITIQAEDLLLNKAPEKPDLKVENSNVIVTPNKVDTDASKVEVTYTGKDGNSKTLTATKDDSGWTIDGDGAVDANGVITLPKDNVKGDTDVTATVTDKGGIADDDKTPLTSDPGSLPIKETKADKVKALGGLDPVELKKWVGDTVEWKDGVKAKDSTKETEVNKLLAEATFTDVTDTTRTTKAEGDFNGTIKVTFDDGSSIEVKDQMLYVSNHVTSMKRKDKLPKGALEVEFKLGEGTKVDNTDGTTIDGNKDNPVSYQKYMVKPNTNLKEYKNKTLKETYYNLINSKVKAIDKYTEPVWNNGEGAVTEDFVITEANKVFTATATKTYDITFDANTGGGTKDKVTQKVNTEYELPAKDTFTPPNENQEFSGWQIGDDSTNLKQPGAKITITGDTTVKAIWKPIELKVNFLPGTGASGEMKDVPVNKGSDYKLPEPTFKAPENQKFAGWKVGNEDGVKKAGDTIKITGNVTLTATWEDIMVNVSYDANGGSGKMEGKELKKGSTYKLLANSFKAPNENQEFKAWEVDGKEVAAGTEITVDKDTTVKAIWKPIEFKVKFQTEVGASGTMEEKTVNKGSKYELPTPTFTPDKDKEFAGWKVPGEAKVKKAGEEIDISGDVTLTATWKDIMVNVSYDANGGSGKMEGKELKKGSTLTLPANGFTAPAGKEFAGWQVGNETKKPGDTIKVDANTVVKALWKTKAQPGKDTGNKEERPIFFYIKPTTKPVLNLKDHSQYMIGYKDGTFRPNNKMSRQEVTVMLSRLLSERPQKGMIYSRDYKDVADNLWSVTAISYMSNLKMVKGYPDGNFRPTANITRAEFAAMVVRFENISAAGSKTFTDLQKDHWAYEVIQKAAQAGWISGYPDGSFRPDQPITRAEVVAITNRMLNRFADEEYVDHNLNKIINFTDIDKSHWAYYPVVEATNGHNYDRKANGKDETWFEVTGSTFVYDK